MVQQSGSVDQSAALLAERRNDPEAMACLEGAGQVEGLHTTHHMTVHDIQSMHEFVKHVHTVGDNPHLTVRTTLAGGSEAEEGADLTHLKSNMAELRETFKCHGMGEITKIQSGSLLIKLRIKYQDQISNLQQGTYLDVGKRKLQDVLTNGRENRAVCHADIGGLTLQANESDLEKATHFFKTDNITKPVNFLFCHKQRCWYWALESDMEVLHGLQVFSVQAGKQDVLRRRLRVHEVKVLTKLQCANEAPPYEKTELCVICKTPDRSIYDEERPLGDYNEAAVTPTAPIQENGLPCPFGSAGHNAYGNADAGAAVAEPPLPVQDTQPPAPYPGGQSIEQVTRLVGAVERNGVERMEEHGAQISLRFTAEALLSHPLRGDIERYQGQPLMDCLGIADLRRPSDGSLLLAIVLLSREELKTIKCQDVQDLILERMRMRLIEQRKAHGVPVDELESLTLEISPEAIQQLEKFYAADLIPVPASYVFCGETRYWYWTADGDIFHRVDVCQVQAGKYIDKRLREHEIQVCWKLWQLAEGPLDDHDQCPVCKRRESNDDRLFPKEAAEKPETHAAGAKMADEEEDPASTSHSTSDRGLHTGDCETPLDAPPTANVLKSTSCPNTTAGSSMDPSCEIMPLETSVCVVCTDSAADVTFEPCGHKFTCHECSPRMTKCLKCKAVITKKCPTADMTTPSPATKTVGTFKIGDTVKTDLDADILMAMQDGHGGWTSEMTQYISKTGTVDGITSGGDVIVKFDDENTWTFHVDTLKQVHPFAEGDHVVINDDAAEVKTLQEAIGMDWSEDMKNGLGQVGKVLEVGSDGSLLVSVGDHAWRLNYKICTLTPPDQSTDTSIMARQLRELLTLVSEAGETPMAAHQLREMLTLASQDGKESTLEDQLLEKLTKDIHDSYDEIAIILRCLVHMSRESQSDPLMDDVLRGFLDVMKRILTGNPEMVVAVTARDGSALQAACAGGFTDIVRLLIKYGANQQSADEDGDTMLHLAVLGNHVEVVKQLLELGASIDATNKQGLTALDSAVHKEHVACAETLLEHGAVANFQDAIQGKSALHVACYHGELGVVTQMLERGANLHLKDHDGATALHYAAAGNWPLVIRLLLQRGAYINVVNKDGHSALHAAAGANHVECVKVLLDNGADVNLQDNSAGQSALHMASHRGAAEIIDLLVAAGADINLTDGDGDTNVGLSVYGNQPAVLQHLLKRGANIDAINREGLNPLLIAAHKNRVDCCKVLVDKGANINIQDCSQSKTALHIACHEGHLEIVRHLLGAGASMDLRDEDGNTMLHYCVNGHNAGALETLLQQGAAVNAVNNSGMSPLHMAALKEQMDSVDILLKHGASVNIQDRAGDTALHDTIRKGQVMMTEHLLKQRGADFTLKNVRGFNILHWVAYHGHANITERILNQKPGIVNIQKDDGFTALHLATQKGQYNVVQTLVAKGKADLAITNNCEQTPLHLAASKLRVATVEYLLSHGARVCEKDADGNTCAHLALMASEKPEETDLAAAPCIAKIHSDLDGELGQGRHLQSAIVAFLVVHGADLKSPNRKNETALDLIGDPKIIQAIRTVSSNHTGPQSTEQWTSTAVDSSFELPECVICSAASATVTFKPCGHRITCSDCSLRMKECYKCNAQITEKLATASSAVVKNADRQPKEIACDLFKIGDKVRTDLDVDVLKAMQDGHGGWNPQMAEYISKEGTVCGITKQGDIKVRFDGTARPWCLHSGALAKVGEIKVGDFVSIDADVDRVKELQEGHGGWTSRMRRIPGKVGKVVKMHRSGDLRVSVCNSTWTLNPAVCTISPHAPQDTDKAQDPDESLGVLQRVLMYWFSLHKLSGSSLIMQEALHGFYGVIGDIIRKYPDKVNDANPTSALHVASSQGHVEFVRQLVSAGAELDRCDSDGDTAIHFAVIGNEPEIVELLIREGADVNALNNNCRSPLHMAISKRHAECVNVLVKEGANVNIQDSYGDTALHDAINGKAMATIELLVNHPDVDFTLENNRGFNVLHQSASRGNIHAMQHILRRAKETVDAKHNDGRTALHLAARSGHHAMIPILCSEGANVNAVTNEGSTALHLARKHVQCVQLLLECGADVNIQDSDGDTALHLAIDKNKVEVIKLLVSHPTIDFMRRSKRGLNALHHAALRGSNAATELILQRAPEMVDLRTDEGFTALHVAAVNGHTEVASTLITTGKANVDLTAVEGVTALFHAASSGNPEITDLLLRHGARIDNVTCEGNSALQVAVSEQNVDHVKAILRHAADINMQDSLGDTALHDAIAEDNVEIKELLTSHPGVDFCITNQRGFSVLHQAVLKDDSQTAENIIRREPSTVSIRDNDGRTALHLAIECDHHGVVFALLTKDDFRPKPSVDCKNTLRQEKTWDEPKAAVEAPMGHTSFVDIVTNDGRSPLHVAVNKQDKATIEKLVEMGANLNLQDSCGNTALHKAIGTVSLEVLQLIISQPGVNFELENNDGFNVLQLAAQTGDNRATELLLQEWPSIVDLQNDDGVTALHLAALDGQTEVASTLLKQGKADVNLCNANGDTALHIATGQPNHNKMMVLTEVLLDQGAKVDAVNKQRQTPLHLAVKMQQARCVSLLLERRSNVNLQDLDGDTALHHAIRLSSLEIVKLLLTQPNLDLTVMNIGGYNVLHFAARIGNNNAVIPILSRAPLLVDVLSENGRTALHLAAEAGHSDVASTLIKQGQADLKICSKRDGMDSLHLAAANGHSAIVELCVSNGASLDVEDSLRNTCLHLALMASDSTEISLTLAPNIAEIHSDLVDKLGVGRHHAAAMAVYLVGHGAQLRHKNHKKMTALDLCKDDAAKEVLLRTARDYQTKNPVGKLAADTSAVVAPGRASPAPSPNSSPPTSPPMTRRTSTVFSFQQPSKPEQLTQCEQPIASTDVDQIHVGDAIPDAEVADIGDIDSVGNTGLHNAIIKGNADVIEMLIRQPIIDFASKNNGGLTVLHCASLAGNTIVTERIIESAPQTVNTPNNDGNTALHLAVEEGHYNVALTLTEHGAANLEQRNNRGQTALLLATSPWSHGNPAIIELLVGKGARVDAEDDDGNTCLHLALRASDTAHTNMTGAPEIAEIYNDTGPELGESHRTTTALVKYLLSHGADLHHKNRQGKTAFDLVSGQQIMDSIKHVMSSSTDEVVVQDKCPERTAERTVTTICKAPWPTPKWRQAFCRVWGMFLGLVMSFKKRLDNRVLATFEEEVQALERGSFDYDHHDTRKVKGAINDYVCSMCTAIAEEDPLWYGLVLHFVGSFYDGTRVSASPNEFDVLVTVSGKGVFLQRDTTDGEWSVWVTGEVLKVCRGGHGKRDIILREENGMGKVDPKAFHDRWQDDMDSKLASVPPPDGLTHGGLVSPKYSGMGVARPAASPRLTWQEVTPVSLDFTPAFCIPRDALQSSTLERMGTLFRVAGLPESAPYPAHLVPGREKWIPTTAVVEARSLTSLGANSESVHLIRAIKLLSRHYLQWCPEESDVQQARESLEALVSAAVTVNTSQVVVPGESTSVERADADAIRYVPGTECFVPVIDSGEAVSGVVDLVGLVDCVEQSMRSGILQLPNRREGEEEGEPGQGVYWSRVALVVAAVHRAHRPVGPTDQATCVQTDCPLCAEMIRHARYLGLYPAAIHPAVGEAVGIPDKPWLAIRSAYVKYLVLRDVIDGRLPEGRKAEFPDAGGSCSERRGVHHYMARLASDLKKGGWGSPVAHPLLTAEGVRPIFPRSVRRLPSALSENERANRRADWPDWCWPSESLISCHYELCRRLCEVSRWSDPDCE